MNGKELMQERSRSLESLRHLRLMALLRDLERDEGRVKTAELLGISYRTLVRAVESGRLTGRMSDALERMLLSGGGSAAAQQRERFDALEQRITELKERMEGLEKEMRSSLEDGGPAVHGELGRRLDEGAQAVGELAGRVARLEVAQAGKGIPEAHGSGKERRPVYNGSFRAGVVTKEPHPGEEASYGPGMPLVVEWRHLWSVREEGTRLTQTKGRERIMVLEIAMIGEYELTLPPDTAPLHPSVREDYLGWRRRALVDIQRERARRELMRLLRRVLTLGLWWK